MATWKKASKVNQKIHLERHQPEFRKDTGFLEKKKDYKLRAIHFQEGRDTLKLLKKRALNRNPDEFYHHMINSKVVNGEHKEKSAKISEEDSREQKKLMVTQDLKYIKYKRTTELKKIEKLKSNLHLIDMANKYQNKHIFFVDDEKELKKFDLAKRLDTAPELVHLKVNRPRIKDLNEKLLVKDSLELNEQIGESYNELKKRLEREKELSIVERKLTIKNHLNNKKSSKPVLVKKGSKNEPPVYAWKSERNK